MTTLTDWLTDAKARADAATDGPWSLYRHESIKYPQVHCTQGRLLSVVDGYQVEPDAAFIAAARTEHPAMVDALTAVRAMHHPVDRAAVACDDDECQHATCTRITVTICSACDEMCATAYFYYAESSLEVVEWPCPTVRAVTTALGVTP